MSCIEAVPGAAWECADIGERGLVLLGTDGRVLLWDTSLERVSGVSGENAVGRKLVNLLPHTKDINLDQIIAQAHQKKKRLIVRLPESHPFQSIFVGGIMKKTVRLLVVEALNNPSGISGTLIFFFFKEEMSLQNDVQVILDGLADAVISFDAGGIVKTFNVTAEKIFGDRSNEVVGKAISRLIPELGLFVTGLGKFSLEQQWELNGVRKNGDVFPFELALSKIDRDGKTLYIAVGSDITDRKKATEQMRKLAHYDALTGLPNRLLFEERLNQALASAKRRGGKIAVLMLDLDRFKEVNDTYGHHTGDVLLREVGNRLTHCVRETDTVARLGGDEFVIVLTGLTEGAAAAVIADTILQEITRPLVIDQAEIYPATSIGISIFPDDTVEMAQLLKNADMALYRSKSSGRGTYHFYIASMNEEVHARKQMENELHRAIEQQDSQQLSLYFQPLVTLQDGAVYGAEVLVRWQRADKVFVPPAEFLPAIEKTDSIILLGQWIIEQACKTLVQWQKRGDLPTLRLAINLSMAQFKHPDLFAMVCRILEKYEISPSLLRFEVTETVVMDNMTLSDSLLGKFHEQGLDVSIDDYGTGYSSLQYLQSLQINRLKIDQIFLEGIERETEQANLLQAIVNLGHAIGLDVNVKGVETEGQLALLRRFGVNGGQGYLFSPPLPE